MEDFDRSLPMMLNRTLDSVMPWYREVFQRYNLTEPQWRVLRVIWAGGEIKSVDLASRTLLAPASIVGIIDRLEKKDYVSRVRSTTDRRAVYINATARGRELQALVSPQITAIEQRLKALVTEQEWVQMEQTLTKISCSLHDKQLAGSPVSPVENYK